MNKGATFHFRQFELRHAQSMKVGTDSVLLGAWARVEGVQRALDVGTGSGLLALMLAQRLDEARIDAIEINSDAASEAQFNFKQSPWNMRLRHVEADFLSWQTDARYDLIISNPPYFEKSMLPPALPRVHARHTIALHAREILAFSEDHLTATGRLHLILPATEAATLIAHARDRSLALTRRCAVRSRTNKPVERLLLEFSRQPQACEETELTLFADGNRRSDAYQALTQSFYTKG